MAAFIAAVGFPWVPAVVMVSAVAGIPDAAVVLTAVDVPGIPAMANVSVPTAVEVLAATVVYTVPGVSAVVGVPAIACVSTSVNILCFHWFVHPYSWLPLMFQLSLVLLIAFLFMSFVLLSTLLEFLLCRPY